MLMAFIHTLWAYLDLLETFYQFKIDWIYCQKSLVFLDKKKVKNQWCSIKNNGFFIVQNEPSVKQH